MNLSTLILSASILFITGQTKSLRDGVKTSINLDLSRDLPYEVDVEIIEDIPNSFCYLIKEEFYANYKIGRVINDDELILEDDEGNIERRVLFVYCVDHSEYIEVIDIYNSDGGTAMDMEEFVKRPGSSSYKSIIRKPIELDIMMEEDTELLGMDDTHEHVTRYFVKDDMRFDFVIGQVKYGECIINDTVEGILNRKVVFDESISPHILKISSYTRDGKSIDAKYEYVGGEDGFKFID